MEIRQLRYAVRLAEYGRFTLAAQASFITQSAFSQQISQLEGELGVQLFTRSSTGTVPTGPGERFLDHARAVLARLDELESEVHAMAGGYTGVLQLGMFGAGAGEFTPLLVDAFRSWMPEVEVVFHDLSMDKQFEKLRTGEIDVSIVHPLCDSDDIEFMQLFEEPRLAALPAKHELIDAPAVSVAELTRYPFVRAGGGTPGVWRDFWAYGDTGGKQRRHAEMMTIREGLDAVAYLNVIDTVPASSTRFHRHPGVAFVPLVDASYSSIAVARRVDDTRTVVEVFCHLADQLAAQHYSVVPGAVRPPR